MTGYTTTEDVLDDGELVFISVVDAAGAVLLSVPGSAALDLYAVDMQPRHTVLLPGSCPLAILTASVGLHGYEVIGHPLFAESTANGAALVRAACSRDGAVFIEFDRDVTPPASPGCRKTGRRIDVCYRGATTSRRRGVPRRSLTAPRSKCQRLPRRQPACAARRGQAGAGTSTGP